MSDTREVKSGDTVKMHYRGTFEDGVEFDSSIGRKPLEFKVGSHQVIEGFDKAAIGMIPGDKKKIVIPPEQAYGNIVEELVFKVPTANIPAHITPKEDMDLLIDDGAGGKMKVTVKEITQEHILLDGNHSMAGKTLVFDLELDSIID